MNKISVIGLGYIGLPTAAIIASEGKNVIGVDIQEDVVNKINSGFIHIVENGLDEMVKEVVESGNLSATLNPEPADVFIIAVPTPFKKNEDNQSNTPQPDLNYLEQAIQSISPLLVKGNLVIIESTSPVGTTEKIATWLKDNRPDLKFPSEDNINPDINIAYCPERVLPGNILKELVENDRVIGGITPYCSEKAKELYKIFLNGHCLVTNARTAEMVKLTENSSRDIQIAFANELSILCNKLDINVWELINLSNHHPRVNILQPGPGVGGHCIAVDPWFIISEMPNDAKLIRCAREVNDGKTDWVINKINKEIAKLKEYKDDTNLKIRLACYGLSFKADIDDLRESPAVRIVKELEENTEIQLFAIEPNIEFLPKEFSNTELVSMSYAVDNADLHILLVDHLEFKSIRPNSGSILDTKGIWE